MKIKKIGGDKFKTCRQTENGKKFNVYRYSNDFKATSWVCGLYNNYFKINK